MYGAGVFYEDAIEEIYPQACMQAIEEKGLDSVAPPRVEITDLGKEGFTFKAIVTVRPVITLKQYKAWRPTRFCPPSPTRRWTMSSSSMWTAPPSWSRWTGPLRWATAWSWTMRRQGWRAFEGGSAKGYELAAGSHTFIPGFGEQVVGMKAGEEKTLI